MAKRRGRLLGRHSFKLGDVFPADDKMSTYVMRLSMALGDLRIVADYATRARQEPDTNATSHGPIVSAASELGSGGGSFRCAM